MEKLENRLASNNFTHEIIYSVQWHENIVISPNLWCRNFLERHSFRIVSPLKAFCGGFLYFVTFIRRGGIVVLTCGTILAEGIFTSQRNKNRLKLLFSTNTLILKIHTREQICHY